MEKDYSGYCCAHCLSREAAVQCGHQCGAAFYCGQDCANDHYEEHKLQCIEARAGRGRGRQGGGRRRGARGKMHNPTAVVLEEGGRPKMK